MTNHPRSHGAKLLMTFPEWFEDKEGDIPFEDITAFHTDCLKRWVAGYVRYVKRFYRISGKAVKPKK